MKMMVKVEHKHAKTNTKKKKVNTTLQRTTRQSEIKDETQHLNIYISRKKLQSSLDEMKIKTNKEPQEQRKKRFIT
jgi:hypothetical protein